MCGRNSIRVAQCLRGDPVLAIPAMIVAAEHSKAHRKRSRQCVEERLLFDGVELQRSHVAMRHKQFAATVESHPANTIQAIGNHAAMPARKAAEFAAFKLLVELAFG